jgi:hypothetical protein
MAVWPEMQEWPAMENQLSDMVLKEGLGEMVVKVEMAAVASQAMVWAVKPSVEASMSRAFRA